MSSNASFILSSSSGLAQCEAPRMLGARLGVGHGDGLLHVRRKPHQGGQNVRSIAGRFAAKKVRAVRIGAAEMLPVARIG